MIYCYYTTHEDHASCSGMFSKPPSHKQFRFKSFSECFICNTEQKATSGWRTAAQDMANSLQMEVRYFKGQSSHSFFPQ